MRQGCTSCVEYLPARTCQAMNKNAKVKRHIHEAKLCIRSAWFLVHLSSCRTKERCVGVGIMYADPCSFPFFLFLQKVSGQQILEICVKDFVWICSHLCFKESSNSKDSYSMDPKLLAIILFHYNFFKRELFFFFQRVFIIVHQIFISFRKT